MTELEELKAAYVAACDAAGAAWDDADAASAAAYDADYADYAADYAAYDADCAADDAYGAYRAELKKTQKENTSD